MLDGFGRQALHARELSFEHPQTGEVLSFAAKVPADMSALVACLEEEDPP
jgi:23S rRNA pseudouridine1911/1915/1917 synthase